MFTLLRNGDHTDLDTLLDVVRIAHPEDPVYVPGRGWMTVGDLRWDMDTTAQDAAGPAPPTSRPATPDSRADPSGTTGHHTASATAPADPPPATHGPHQPPPPRRPRGSACSVAPRTLSLSATRSPARQTRRRGDPTP